MRKWIAAGCAAALAVGVVACGSDDNGGSGSSSSSGSSSGGGKKLTLIAGVKGDEFYLTMNCGAQAEAKAKGATLDFQGPDKFDASLQTPIVNAVAAKKPDQALIAQEPADIGKQGVDQALAALNGDKTTEKIGTGFTVITKDNLDQNQSALYKSTC